ncbi:tRNA (guanosine(46)-N7)-methyltransferase TrmB [Thiorhodococcus mannitoliphagus]|uniref:tRNA (guanine-N(7)-)-methyltransferase n=1 Tax=Thiorhodococcus mannitoliphagus TaxID=329406 RepID=A0A6P1E122_9GAMM|nr:tRNA (guanosine(46)-N7)-methyltransferase TrmB [Thiorhodococcus mannitoliphagus]NEX21435.1 tRNA (guanosine(46)-N7)-methyltransferase TrmB [Thiorhodococcus mannitoliphagus]
MDAHSTDKTPNRRPVRSFVLREGRLTPAQDRAFRELWPLHGVDWTPGAQIDFAATFGSEKPVVLEIGFGNGDSLAEMAAADLNRNWLGIEVHRPGVGHLLLEIERRGLSNLKVMRHDAVEVLTQGIAAASLDAVQLFFPDPWPKRRHHKRRILSPQLIQLLAKVIRPGGVFHAATDWEPYAEQMLEILDSATDCFESTAGVGRYAPRPATRPLTKFEQRGERLGHPVHDLLYRRR